MPFMKNQYRPGLYALVTALAVIAFTAMIDTSVAITQDNHLAVFIAKVVGSIAIASLILWIALKRQSP